MIDCSPCQITRIGEPRHDDPSIMTIGEFIVYPDAIIETIVDGQFVNRGQLNSCIPVPELT